MTGSAHTPDPADIPDDLSGLTGEPDDAILGDPDLDAAEDSEDDADPRHRAPLIVDAAPLHALVDELNELLHSYVGTAVGVSTRRPLSARVSSSRSSMSATIATPLRCASSSFSR